MHRACTGYTVGMAKNVQIRNVPDDAVATIKRRAADAGMSMSEYLRQEVIAHAEQPTVSEVLARAAARWGTSGLTVDEIVEGVREDRESH
jgi:plasmid stability protein